jgi:hypothetical protein
MKTVDLIQEIKSLSGISEDDDGLYLEAINHILRFELVNLNLEAMKAEVIFNKRERLGNDLLVPILSSYEANYNAITAPASELLEVPADWLEPRIAINKDVISNGYFFNSNRTIFHLNDYLKEQSIVSTDIFIPSQNWQWLDTDALYLSCLKTIIEVYYKGKPVQTRTISVTDTNVSALQYKYLNIEYKVDFKNRSISINILNNDNPLDYYLKVSSYKDTNGFSILNKLVLIYKNSVFARFESSEVDENNDYLLRESAIIRYPAIIHKTQELPAIFDDYNLKDLIVYMSALHIQEQRGCVSNELDALTKKKITEYIAFEQQYKQNDKSIYETMFCSDRAWTNNLNYRGLI